MYIETRKEALHSLFLIILKLGVNILMKDIFLSDVIQTNLFRKGSLNVIVAPCGSGKTKAAIDTITPLASSPYKALYLIDTISGCHRVANDESRKLSNPCLFYDMDVVNGGFDFEFDKSKVVVTTYAKFGVWCSLYPDFCDHFEVIVCDEVHNLDQFAAFGNHFNFTATAKDRICAAVKRGKTLFVGITATPEYLKKLCCPQYFVPLDTSRLHHYTEEEVVRYTNINQLLRNLPPHLCGAIYVTRVTTMIELERIARECGFNPICLWSLSHKEHRMTDEQLRVRAHLLEYEEVPPPYNLLIINASCETAINIRSHMNFFIVHNTNPTHITQARGRYRANLHTLYVLDKESGTVIVPEEFIDRKLFREGKADLNNAIYIKNDKGRLIPWKKLSHLITDSGYTITEGKSNDRPYIIIQRL